MKAWTCGRRGHRGKFWVGIPVWVGLIAGVIWGVMALWNWLMPALFVGVRPIDYWQALGLLVLSKILFGGGPGRWGRRRHWEHWSPEERERFRSRFDRCSRRGKAKEASE